MLFILPSAVLSPVPLSRLCYSMLINIVLPYSFDFSIYSNDILSDESPIEKFKSFKFFYGPPNNYMLSDSPLGDIRLFCFYEYEFIKILLF